MSPRGSQRGARAIWRRAGRIALHPVLLLGSLVSLWGLTSVAGFAVWVWRTSSQVDLSRTRDAAIVYAASQRLGAGVSVEAADVAGTLRRLQYQEVAHQPRRPGEFRRGPSAWDIYLHPRDGLTSPLANGGARVVPTAIRAVVSPGAAAEAYAKPGTAVLRPEEAFVVTHLLRGVMDRGTGAPARSLGIRDPVAGKTGTTNEGRDAWFVGYAPRLVALVWIGFDERDVLGLSGAEAALPIWADFMRTALAVTPSGDFSVPPFVTFQEVDATNGKLASPFCPLRIREAFLPFTEPREVCTDHDPPSSPLLAVLQPVSDVSR
ncbi:MAG: penicillin-binding transpeptidase domain-containing protein [Candidatus Rokuibacteriota bacterium]